ncbi:MAG: glycosyltransferase [Acidimicrobiia bacterium]|nr:glycosyltransferase [Acidimicrobiia bacterium]
MKKTIKKLSPDVVFAVNADAAAACAHAWQSLNSPAQKVFELHGVESEEAIASGNVQRDAPAHRQRVEIESRALEWADFVVAPTAHASSWGGDRTSNDAQWLDLPTLSDIAIDDDQLRRDRQFTRTRLGWNKNRIALYVGGMSPWQQPDLMMKTFSSLYKTDDSWRLLVATQDADSAARIAASHAIPEALVAIETHPHAKIAEIASAGDIAFLLRKPHLMNLCASPTKFAEYLEAGVPVAISNSLPTFSALCRSGRVGVEIQANAGPQEIANEIASFVDGNSRAGSSQLCRQESKDKFRMDRAVETYNQILERAAR